MSYSHKLLQGSVLDLDADVSTYSSRVTSAGGSLSLTELRAFNKYVTNAKALGTWPYILDQWPAAGGYQGVLVKLKVHPSIGGGHVNIDASAGTAMAAGNYNSAYGFVQLSGNILKSRLTLANIPYNNFTYSIIRPQNQNYSSSAQPGFGYLHASLQHSFGFAGNTFPVLYPMWNNGVNEDLAKAPYAYGNWQGVWTICHYPTSGTEYINLSYSGSSKLGERTEDPGISAWSTPSGEIGTVVEGVNNTMSGYVIASGMPENLIAIHQDLLVSLHNDLGRADLTPSRDAIRFIQAGDSITAGFYSTPIVKIVNNYPLFDYTQIAAFQGGLGLSGYRIAGPNDGTSWTIKFDDGFYNLKNGFHKSGKTDNNYVIVELGTNDLYQNWHGGDMQVLKDALDAFMGRWKALGWKVLYITPWPAIAYFSAPVNATYATNAAAFIALVAADPDMSNGVKADGVIRMDLLSEFSDPSNTTYFYDGLHLTEAGNTVYANYTSYRFAQIYRAGLTNFNKLPTYDISTGFNHMDGAVTQTFEEPTSQSFANTSGNWAIRGMKATELTAVGGSVVPRFVALLNPAPPSATGTIQVDVTKGGFSGFAIRYVDANNCIEVVYNTASQLYVFKVVAGVRTTVSTVSVLASPTKRTLKVVYSPTNIEVFEDGVSKINVANSDHGSAVDVGLLVWKDTGRDSGSTFDNFSGNW